MWLVKLKRMDKTEGAKEYVEVQHTQNGRIRVQYEGNRGMTYSTEYQYVL